MGSGLRNRGQLLIYLANARPAGVATSGQVRAQSQRGLGRHGGATSHYGSASAMRR